VVREIDTAMEGGQEKRWQARGSNRTGKSIGQVV
jgi:hypothetical protein